MAREMSGGAAAVGARAAAWRGVAAAALAGLLGLLAGCGGGSEDGTTAPVVVNSFPFRAAVVKLNGSAQKTDFSISGTCAGTASYSRATSVDGNGQPTVVSFESLQAYRVAQTLTSTFTDCSPTSYAFTINLYTDAQFNPLGSYRPGVDFGVAETTPLALPTTIGVGDTALQAVHIVYADNTKKTVVGQRVYSWVAEEDSASTVIMNFIVRHYGYPTVTATDGTTSTSTTLTLELTEQYRYSLDDLGSMLLISIDQQYADTAQTHYVFTAL